MRSAAGYSPQNGAEPFANFYFGGLGNNYVDHQTEKRYRHYYSFPGVELNEIAGRNFVRTLVEWNLPPVLFSRVGTPGFYLTWARPALFASGLVTNMDRSSLRRVDLETGEVLQIRAVPGVFGEGIAGHGAVGHFDHGLHFFAPVLVRDPEDRDGSQRSLSWDLL